MSGGKQYNFIVGGRGMGRIAALEHHLESYKKHVEMMNEEINTRDEVIRRMSEKEKDIVEANSNVFRELGKTMEKNELLHKENKEMREKLKNTKHAMSSFYGTMYGVDTDTVYVPNTEANVVIARVKRKIVEENKGKIVPVQPDIYFMAEKIEKLEEENEELKMKFRAKSVKNTELKRLFEREQKAYSAMERENQLLHDRTADMADEMGVMECCMNELKRANSSWNRNLVMVGVVDERDRLVRKVRELKIQVKELDEANGLKDKRIKMLGMSNNKLIDDWRTQKAKLKGIGKRNEEIAKAYADASKTVHTLAEECLKKDREISNLKYENTFLRGERVINNENRK